MLETKEAKVGFADPAQATSLSVLVDLEARWENLRKTPSRDPQVRSTLQDLQNKQKAYDVFRAKLVAYNKLYKPAHVPELLLNTPTRLGLWCRAMRDLYRQVENDLQAHCPVYLLEKAYRWADLLGARVNKPLVSRSNVPSSIRAAIQDLEALSQWCDDLAKVAAPAPPKLAILRCDSFETGTEEWNPAPNLELGSEPKSQTALRAAAVGGK